MIQTDNTTLAVAQAMIALRDKNNALTAEVERLKAENAELRYIVEQFFDDWYCEDGCPKQKDKNFPCYGEEENETTAEFYPGECSLYQTKCWVEYYRWKYRQNDGKDTNVLTNVPATPEKGGEDE